MEDTEMNFDVNKLIAKLNDLGPDYKCPFCGGSEFLVQKQISHLSAANSFSGPILGFAAPIGVNVCVKCGHIDLFSLTHLGLVPKREQENNGMSEDRKNA